MLRTTIIGTGSLPKAFWLARPDAPLFAPWVPPPACLAEAQNDAVRLVLADQEAAGFDIVKAELGEAP